MSWKDTYKVWQERTDLEPDLKQELAAMSDDKELKMPFTVHYHSELQECGD